MDRASDTEAERIRDLFENITIEEFHDDEDSDVPTESDFSSDKTFLLAPNVLKLRSLIPATKGTASYPNKVSRSTNSKTESVISNVSQPYPTLLSSKYLDDGWTECIIRLGTNNKIKQIEGFPMPLQRPKVAAYHIKETDDIGFGMFAARRLGISDLILNERPLVLGPLTVDPDNPINMEKYIKDALDRLPDALAAKYRALFDCHTGTECAEGDGSGNSTLFGIFRTNAFRVDTLYDSEPTDDNGLYCAVGENTSRINHSCRPNALVSFHLDAFSFQVRAIRQIEEGEEIVIPYCDIMLPHKKRDAIFRNFHFECVCQSCQDPAASDAIRSTITSPSAIFKQWLDDRSLPGDYVIRHSLSQIDTMLREGMEGSAVYGEHLQAIMESYICLGDSGLASIWGVKLGRALLASAGDTKNLELMSDGHLYPYHEAWQSRMKNKSKKKRKGKKSRSQKERQVHDNEEGELGNASEDE
ncbi:SET domain-containing protein [Sistotremastrum suecicum HHB10207 ss-3]|uniref:SET domain-containing protein n=1 Tax=Sistotremastrum suecicum HHB10207 ss-3 TaxID=1314776 RepID=A0A166F0K1_9AGAM|nr:SET domain-containing protein [Sistotremastrum suecicum HHB10207 ss-3]